MKYPTVLAAAAFVAAAALTPAHAQTVVFSTEMNGANESPPAATSATGTATLTIDLATSQLRVESSFAGLTSGVTAAHVHCCTAPGTNVPPATQLPSFAGFPSGVTEGTFDGTFDLLDAATYNPAFVTANGAPALDAAGNAVGSFGALLAGLEAGLAYFNIHTTNFPNGEIRGFLQEVVTTPIPEPSTYALMLLGLALVGWAGARQRAR